MLTRDEARKLAEKALSFSSFPDCTINLSMSERAFIRFARNGITTSGFAIEQSMAIVSERAGQAGTTRISEFDDASLRAAVKQTEQLAMLSPANPERMPPLPPQKYPPQENYADTTARARNDVMIPHVRAVVESARGKNLVAAGFFDRTAAVNAILNKKGNFGYGRTTDARLSTTIRNPEGTSSGWASAPAVRIEEIDGAEVARAAVEKCIRWTNPRRLEPGKYTVVLEPSATGDLVRLLGNSLGARPAEEGRSFLSRKGGGTLAGEKLFPSLITLRSDPFHSLYSAVPWSGSGLPVGRVAWIENGEVKNLFYDRYWAEKAGRPATPEPDFLVLEGGDKSLNDLIAMVDRGLLVTRFWYIRLLNPQTSQFTGLTRDGLFLIEKGKVVAPVVNFRFNESPFRLLQNTIAAGKPVRVRGGEGAGMIAPALVVKDFPFTSVSDAV